MGRFNYNASATAVEKKCPGCGGRLAPSKFGGGQWCPAKCGWKDTNKGGGWAKTERPGGYSPLETPSPEQSDIFSAAKDTKDSDHLMIDALAGTGKTTVLTDMAYHYSRRNLSVLCLAFTKRDRTALERKIPESVAKVWTSNAAGLAIVSNYAKLNGTYLGPVNKYFPYDLVQTRFREDGLIAANGEYGTGVRQMQSAVITLVSKARTTLALSAKGQNGLPTHPTDKDWNDLANRFGVECKKPEQFQLVIQYASALFRELADLKTMLRYKKVDHDNCVFLPAYHNMTPPGRYDRVLVDEAQDQSYANRTIAELYRKQSTGRIVAVGDRFQAIYAWRGADQFALDEMHKLMGMSGSIKRYPLNLCRRCGQDIIKEAQQLVHEIEALPDAPSGTVRRIPDDKEFRAELMAKKKGLVLCRANAPLISTCLDLIGKGVPAVVTRSKIIDELKTLVENSCEDGDNGNTPVTKVIETVNLWRADKVSKLSARDGTEDQVQQVEDKAACLFALCENVGVVTAKDVLDLIARLFPEGFETDPEKMVVLSTVHGAKGSEAETVYLYSPNDLDKKGKGSVWDQVWSDETDRDNVLYVAITRAKRELVYAGIAPTVGKFSKPKEDNKPVRDESGLPGYNLPEREVINADLPAPTRVPARGKVTGKAKTPPRAVKAARKGAKK